MPMVVKMAMGEQAIRIHLMICFHLVAGGADAVRRQGGQFRGQSGDHDVGDDVAFERLPAAENDQGGQTAPQGRQHAVIGWAGVQLVYFAHAAGNGHGAAPAQIISGR
jgi:hypothetical protein